MIADLVSFTTGRDSVVNQAEADARAWLPWLRAKFDQANAELFGSSLRARILIGYCGDGGLGCFMAGPPAVILIHPCALDMGERTVAGVLLHEMVHASLMGRRGEHAHGGHGAVFQRAVNRIAPRLGLDPAESVAAAETWPRLLRAEPTVRRTPAELALRSATMCMLQVRGAGPFATLLSECALEFLRARESILAIEADVKGRR